MRLVKYPPGEAASSLAEAVTISTEVAESFAFFAQVLRVAFWSIPNVQAIGFIQSTLRVWVHNDITILTLLTSVGPTVGTHPQTVTLGTSVFSETTAFPLIWRLARNNSMHY